MNLSKKGIPYRAARDIGVVGLFFVFSGGTSVSSFNFLAAALLATGVVIVYTIFLAWEYLVWSRFDYYVEEDSVKITKGVVRRQEREIPFRRIQNVDVKRNIVHRVLGIAKIELETAGGGDTEASLKYVDQKDVESVRESIKHGSREETGEEDGKSDESIYEITDRNLVILSASDIDARLIFLLLAGFGFLSTGATFLIDEVGIAGSLVFTLVILLSTVGFFVANFLRNFEKYYGFKLWRSKDSLKYEAGLLNRREGTIPLEKVQSLGLEENLLKRLLGYATLKIETAGYSGEKAVKKGAEAAIPLAKHGEVVNYAERLGNLQFQEMKPISSQARRRYFARYSILVLLTSVASYFLTESYALTLIVFSAGSLVSAAAAHLKWKHRGYAEGEQNLFARDGFWNRRTDIVPYYRIQNLIQTQTVFQRRWNLSSLTIDTAGSNMILDNPEIPDLETGELTELRESIYTSFQRSIEEN